MKQAWQLLVYFEASLAGLPNLWNRHLWGGGSGVFEKSCCSNGILRKASQGQVVAIEGGRT